jgi:hypothetical protein
MEKYTCKGCVNLLTLHKHPQNQNVFKGSILEPTGLYACIIFHRMDSKGMAVLFDREDAGGCEMYDNETKHDAKKFYTDSRWTEIVKLRNEGKDDIADELMHQVHKDYGCI